MKKLFLENEEMRNNLKDFVENSNQGLRWPNIARQLETIHNITIGIPFELKQVYQDYCCPKPEIDSKNLQLLMEILIDSRCEMGSALEQFVEKTGIKLSCYLLSSKAQQYFKKAIEKGIMAFLKKKMEQKKRLTNFPKASIIRLIKCLDLKPDNPQNCNIIQAAFHLKDILLMYGKYREAERAEYYDAIKERMDKRQFYQTLLCLSFLDELRMISSNLITSDAELLPDYFLQDTIEKNKQLDVYQHLFVNDMQRKYHMYNDAKDLQQEEDFRYYVKENKFSKFKKLSKESISERPSKRVIQTVRGKIITTPKLYPSKKTIRFDKDLKQNIQDNEDEIQANCFSVNLQFFQSNK